jgi:hypothetical protein
MDDNKQPPDRLFCQAKRKLMMAEETRRPTIYVASVFEKPHWRTMLATEDKALAGAMAKAASAGRIVAGT